MPAPKGRREDNRKPRRENGSRTDARWGGGKPASNPTGKPTGKPKGKPTRTRSAGPAPASPKPAAKFIATPKPAPRTSHPDATPKVLTPPPTVPLPPPPDFVAQCSAIGVEFEPGDVEKLGLYLARMLHANEAFNLTAIRDANDAWRKHIFDSLTLLAPLSELAEGATLIDVGSGGGLPGVPIAICMPHLKITLLEATGKKVEFLRSVADALGLRNMTVVHDRAEALGHNRGVKTGQADGSNIRVGAHRESYDAVTARAVGRLATLAELTVPFAKVGGLVLLIKGEQADAELAEAAKALHLLKATHVTTLPTPTGRTVVLTKSSATPKDYPRRDGEPKRSPLGVVGSAEPGQRD